MSETFLTNDREEEKKKKDIYAWKLLTLKKCGLNRPIEYFAMSVVSWVAAAPKPKTPIWRYAFVIHDGTFHSSICNLIFAGVLFNFAWIISVADI